MFAAITTCPRCGSDLESLQTVELGDLRVEYDGAIVLWKGQRVNVRPTGVLLLMSIVRAGGAPVKRWIIADALGYTGDYADNLIAVQLCHLKARFRQVDPDFDMIENIRMQGLRWKVEEDA